jgi:probable phosphoglycerate mutase
MQLIIVRHGETLWTISGQHTGKTELDLTAHGRVQATSLEPLLQNILGSQIPVAYVSPRKRAIQTMQLSLPHIKANIEPLIAEYDYGDYEGITSKQIETLRPGWSIWRDGCPNGESTEDVAHRADKFLAEHVTQSPDPVVIFSHGHFTRILTARALGLNASNGALFTSTPASISVVEERLGVGSLELWNLSADLILPTQTLD